MIEVIYREDVSEETIHEPRNVTQIGSVDPKYRIYMEDAVLTYIRKIKGLEDEVYYGLLLGELKRAAGTTYLFIRGMVKAAQKDTDAKESRGRAGDHRSGSGAVALERLTQDRRRMKETERRRNENVPEEKKEGKCAPTEAIEYRGEDQKGWKETVSGKAAVESAEQWLNSETQSVESKMETPEPEEDGTEENPTRPAIEFDGDTWTGLYEDINHYFPDMEILGWYASFPFLNVAGFDLCRQTHYTHFSGADKVLFLCDRTEREENFYRPDGLELRQTEGYFTFFEKNDAMQIYCRENEPAKEADNAAETGDGRQSGLRQGTVGEAPRKKWSISAASILLTAALLAAVLLVNRYNGRLKSEGADSAEGTVKEESSTVQALAVDGQVMESGADDGDQSGDDENGGGTAVANTKADGSDVTTGDAEDSNNAAAGNAGGNDSSAAAGNAGGNDSSAATGKTGENDNSGTGGNTGEDDSNITSGNTEGDGNIATTGNDEGGDSTAATGNTAVGEDETVQTGSRVSARYYTVQAGETLYSICMDVYRTAAMVEIVRALNGIGEDYAIQAGQKILLP